MNQEENNYLELLKNILENGSIREDRTGVGTIGLFGTTLRFSLENNKIPMLTTKRMFARGVVEELLFFIRGETNTKKLEEKGVNIWKGNTSREFLNSRGLSYLPEGDMGPMYGYLWRNFNGVDQLKNALHLIKTDPYSRRIMVTAHDPSLSNKCCLDSCHVLFQFYVDKGKLSLQWYQRSCDMNLGIPFNILSYAILLRILAKASNLEPGELIFVGGDLHIYKNHINQVNTQILREPYPFPELYIDKNISSIEDIEKLKFEDFRIENYKHHPSIKAQMAI